MFTLLGKLLLGCVDVCLFQFVFMQIHVTSHPVGSVHSALVVTTLKGHLTVLALLGSLEILSLVVMVSSITHSVACSC